MSAPVSNDRIKSMIPRKPAIMNTATITTSVEPTTSHAAWPCDFLRLRLDVLQKSGHPRNIFTHGTLLTKVCTQGHGHFKEAGQEGFEPPTPDLESGALAVRATGPSHGHTETLSLLHHSFHQGTSILSIIVFHGESYAFDKATIFLALQSIGVVRLFFMVE